MHALKKRALKTRSVHALEACTQDALKTSGICACFRRSVRSRRALKQRALKAGLEEACTHGGRCICACFRRSVNLRRTLGSVHSRCALKQHALKTGLEAARSWRALKKRALTAAGVTGARWCPGCHISAPASCGGSRWSGWNRRRARRTRGSRGRRSGSRRAG